MSGDHNMHQKPTGMADRATELACQCLFHSAMLLQTYKTRDALCDSELDELDSIKRFYELVRAEALEDAAKVVDQLADGDDADTAQQFALDIASDKIRELK